MILPPGKFLDGTDKTCSFSSFNSFTDDEPLISPEVRKSVLLWRLAADRVRNGDGASKMAKDGDLASIRKKVGASRKAGTLELLFQWQHAEFAENKIPDRRIGGPLCVGEAKKAIGQLHLLPIILDIVVIESGAVGVVKRVFHDDPGIPTDVCDVVLKDGMVAEKKTVRSILADDAGKPTWTESAISKIRKEYHKTKNATTGTRFWWDRRLSFSKPQEWLAASEWLDDTHASCHAIVEGTTVQIRPITLAYAAAVGTRIDSYSADLCRRWCTVEEITENGLARCRVDGEEKRYEIDLRPDTVTLSSPIYWPSNEQDVEESECFDSAVKEYLEKIRDTQKIVEDAITGNKLDVEEQVISLNTNSGEKAVVLDTHYTADHSPLDFDWKCGDEDSGLLGERVRVKGLYGTYKGNGVVQFDDGEASPELPLRKIYRRVPPTGAIDNTLTTTEDVKSLIPLLLEPQGPPILLRAKAGTGKTWSILQMHYLATKALLDKNCPPLVPYKIFVQKLVRIMHRQSISKDDLAECNLLMKYMEAELEDKTLTVSEFKMLQHSIAKRQFLVFVDGVDEAADLRDEIEDFCVNSLVPFGLRVVVTSRPEGVRLRNYKHNFVIMDLRPLTPEQQEKAVRAQLEGNVFYEHLSGFSKIREQHDKLYHRNFTSHEQGKLETFYQQNRLRLPDGSDWDPDIRHRIGGNFVKEQPIGSGWISEYYTEGVGSQINGDALKSVEDAVNENSANISFDSTSFGKDTKGVLSQKLAKLLHKKRKGNPSLKASDLWYTIQSRTDQILKTAEDGRPIFKKILFELFEEKEITIGPMKDPVRIHEKAEDDYRSRFQDDVIPEANVLDVIRAKLNTDRKGIFRAIQKMNGFEVRHEGQVARVEILQCKSRFKPLDPTRFRFFLLKLAIVRGGEKYYAELQVHHQAFYDWDQKSGSHNHYEFLRQKLASRYNNVVDEQLTFLLEERMRVFQQISRTPVLLSLLIVCMSASTSDLDDHLPKDIFQLYENSTRLVAKKHFNNDNEKADQLIQMLKMIACANMMAKRRQFTWSEACDAMAKDSRNVQLWNEILSKDGAIPFVKTLALGTSSGNFQFKHLSMQESLLAMTIHKGELDARNRFWTNNDVAIERLNEPFYKNFFEIGSGYIGKGFAKEMPAWSFPKGLNPFGREMLNNAIAGADNLISLQFYLPDRDDKAPYHGPDYFAHWFTTSQFPTSLQENFCRGILKVTCKDQGWGNRSRGIQARRFVAKNKDEAGEFEADWTYLMGALPRKWTEYDLNLPVWWFEKTNSPQVTRTVSVGYSCWCWGHESHVKNARLTLDQGEATGQLITAIKIASQCIASGDINDQAFCKLLEEENGTTPWASIVQQNGHEEIVYRMIDFEPRLGRPALLAALNPKCVHVAKCLLEKGIQMHLNDIEKLWLADTNGETKWVAFVKEDSSWEVVERLLQEPKLAETVPKLLEHVLVPGLSSVASRLFKTHYHKEKVLSHETVDKLLGVTDFYLGPSKVSRTINGCRKDAWFNVESDLSLGTQEIEDEYELEFELSVETHRFWGGCVLMIHDGTGNDRLQLSNVELCIYFKSHERANHPTGKADFNSKMFIYDACLDPNVRLSVGVEEGSTKTYRIVRTMKSCAVYVDGKMEHEIERQKPLSDDQYPRQVSVTAVQMSLKLGFDFGYQFYPYTAKLRSVKYASRQTSGWERLVMDQESAQIVDLLLSTPRLKKALQDMKPKLFELKNVEVLERLVSKTLIDITYLDLMQSISTEDTRTRWDMFLCEENATAFVDTMINIHQELHEKTILLEPLAARCTRGSGDTIQRLLNRGATLDQDTIEKLLKGQDRTVDEWGSIVEQCIIVEEALYVSVADSNKVTDGTDVIQNMILEKILDGSNEIVISGYWGDRNWIFGVDPHSGTAKDIIIKYKDPREGISKKLVSPEGSTLRLQWNSPDNSFGRAPLFAKMAMRERDSAFVDNCLTNQKLSNHFLEIYPKVVEYSIVNRCWSIAERLVRVGRLCGTDRTTLIERGMLQTALDHRQESLFLAIATEDESTLFANAAEWLLSGGGLSRWISMMMDTTVSTVFVADLMKLDAKLAEAASEPDIIVKMLGKNLFARVTEVISIGGLTERLVNVLLRKTSDSEISGISYDAALALPDAVIIESPHPYPMSATWRRKILFPGAKSLTVSLDNRSVTDNCLDKLVFGSHEFWEKKLPGVGNESPLSIEAGSVELKFESSSAGSVTWGYRGVVWPHIAPSEWCLWTELLLNQDATCRDLVEYIQQLKEDNSKLADYANSNAMKEFHTNYYKRLYATDESSWRRNV